MGTWTLIIVIVLMLFGAFMGLLGLFSIILRRGLRPIFAFLAIVIGIAFFMGAYMYASGQKAEQKAQEEAAAAADEQGKPPEEATAESPSENSLPDNDTVSGNSTDSVSGNSVDTATIVAEGAETVHMLFENAMTDGYTYDEDVEEFVVHIDNSTPKRYERLYAEEYARRGVRIEMTQFKSYIAEFNGYECTDAVTFPIWSTDQDFYNQLAGVFPVTHSELAGVDINNKPAVNTAIKKHEERMKKEWEALPEQERIDASVEELCRSIYNTPEIGVEWYEGFSKIPLLVKSCPDRFKEMGELIEKAYSKEGKGDDDPVGVDYFLAYNSVEHAKKGEDQYSHTSTEYREKIATPLISVILEMKARKPVRLQTLWNFHRPPVMRDSECRLQLADYQENRWFIPLDVIGKHGQLLVRIGANTDDQRLAGFAQAKPKEKAKETQKTEEKKKATVTTTSQPSTQGTPPSDNPPGDDGGGDNPPPPPPPSNPPKDNAGEPTQTGTGGGTGGGDNEDKRDGDDRKPEDTRKGEEEDRKNKDDGGNTPPPETPPESTTPPENNEGNDGNYDTGGDNSPIGGSDDQKVVEERDNGDDTSTEKEGNTEGNKNTGTVEDE